MYYMSLGKIVFPVTPAKITLKIKNMNDTITLINEGEVNLIKKPGLTDITIDEILLPSFTKYPFAVYMKKLKEDKKTRTYTEREKDAKFLDAEYYLNYFEKWKKRKKPIKFIITRFKPGTKDELLFDTNISVTIEDYEIREDAAKYGTDVVVKLSLKQYRSWGAKKIVVKKKKASKKKGRETTKDKSKTYVVREGDTLLKIAKKQLDSEEERNEIYKLNKIVIEKAAKANGRKSSSNGKWLYAGTKLKLPS